MKLFFDNHWIFHAIYILPAGCRLLCLPKKCEINFLFTHFLCNKLHNVIRTLILKDGIVQGLWRSGGLDVRQGLSLLQNNKGSAMAGF